MIPTKKEIHPHISPNILANLVAGGVVFLTSVAVVSGMRRMSSSFRLATKRTEFPGAVRKYICCRI